MLVLPWSRIAFGSTVGPMLGLASLWVARERKPQVLVAAAVAACAGTWLWKAMLNIRHAGVIEGDIPFRPFPISWQDTGTATFCLCGRHRDPSRHAQPASTGPANPQGRRLYDRCRTGYRHLHLVATKKLGAGRPVKLGVKELYGVIGFVRVLEVLVVGPTARILMSMSCSCWRSRWLTRSWWYSKKLCSSSGAPTCVSKGLGHRFEA